jgi:hypothetical protein
VYEKVIVQVAPEQTGVGLEETAVAVGGDINAKTIVAESNPLNTPFTVRA